MKELLRYFVLPKELRIKAFWYMLCNITFMSVFFPMCFLEDRLLVRVFFGFCVVGNYYSAQTFASLIMENKMQDFFFYIFLANAIDIVIATIEILLLLKDLPMWVMIFPLILLALLSGYSMMEIFFEKQMSIIKKTLMRACSSRYYRDHRAHMWFPVDTNTFEPYYKLGDMLCLKRVDISYDKLNNECQRLVIEDSDGVLHLYIKGQEIVPERDNIKAIYKIEHSVRDFRFYDEHFFRDCPEYFEYK